MKTPTPYPIDIDARTICTVENINLLIAGAPGVEFNGMHYCNPGDEIAITAEIHQDGAIRSDLTLPVTIKMPIVRHASGRPTDDEIYHNVSLASGVMTIVGVIPKSGDWKILTSRNNDALKEIKADWKLDTPDVTFIA